MHTKLILGIGIIILNINCLHGQSIKFRYDENGNRINRVIKVNEFKAGSIKFPVTDPKDLFIENQETRSSDVVLATLVYPNPSKGLLKIDITNMPAEAKTETVLYDLSGAELIVNRNSGNHYEMDISLLPDGIYILRIKVNESLFNWKVVKSQ
jgi:hypothetical protein